MATQPNRSADGREAIQMPIEDACKGQMVSRAVAHQRQIRDQHALEVDPLLEDKKRQALSLKNAWVREISRAEAETIILKYEWLKSMGTTDYQFGLYFGEHLVSGICLWERARTSGQDVEPRSLCALGTSTFCIVSDISRLSAHG